MDYVITEKESGITVKEYVSSYLTLSNSALKRLKQKHNGIMINGLHVTVRELLKVGDTLSLGLETTDEEINDKIIPVNIPLDILYEDDDIIAINKPYNMPVHTSMNHHDDTLANAVAYRFADRGIPFVFRCINRLDRDTSGIVLIAKRRDSAAYYGKEIALHRVVKNYTALLDGLLKKDHDIIRTGIKRECEGIIKRCVCSVSEGDYAETEYNVIQYYDNMTLVNAIPHTGRTHQLRVHFAHIGHPILGDSLYGSESSIINRQALHCSSMEFNLMKGGKIKIRAPLPGDIGNILTDNH